MTKQELSKFFDEILNFFPKANFSSYWGNIWWKSLKSFTYEDAQKALKSYCESNNYPPTIEKFRPYLANCQKSTLSFSGSLPSSHNTESLRKFRESSPIEFCMDILGTDAVIEQIKKSLPNQSCSWSELLNNKNWIPLYKIKLSELFETAKAFDSDQYHHRFLLKDGSYFRKEWFE